MDCFPSGYAKQNHTKVVERCSTYSYLFLLLVLFPRGTLVCIVRCSVARDHLRDVVPEVGEEGHLLLEGVHVQLTLGRSLEIDHIKVMIGNPDLNGRCVKGMFGNPDLNGRYLKVMVGNSDLNARFLKVMIGNPDLNERY